MLVLLFELGSDRYALDVQQVIEVLPLVRITQVPQPPRGVAGMLNYRGAPVPVIDLTEVLLGRPSQSRLSTRIIMVRSPAGEHASRVVGLIAEHVTETMRCPAQDFVESGVFLEGAPYLGRIATNPNGMVQLVDISKLLSAPVRDLLFHQVAKG